MRCPASFAVRSGCGPERSVWQGPVESWVARSPCTPVRTAPRMPSVAVGAMLKTHPDAD